MVLGKQRRSIPAHCLLDVAWYPTFRANSVVPNFAAAADKAAVYSWCWLQVVPWLRSLADGTSVTGRPAWRSLAATVRGMSPTPMPHSYRLRERLPRAHRWPRPFRSRSTRRWRVPGGWATTLSVAAATRRHRTRAWCARTPRCTPARLRGHRGDRTVRRERHAQTNWSTRDRRWRTASPVSTLQAPHAYEPATRFADDQRRPLAGRPRPARSDSGE